jgi:hypothetical protein
LVPKRKQIVIDIDDGLYHALVAIARQESHSVPQAARLLLDEGLRQRTGQRSTADEVPSTEISVMAMAAGSFGWLVDESDLYNDACGEPI